MNSNDNSVSASQHWGCRQALAHLVVVWMLVIQNRISTAGVLPMSHLLQPIPTFRKNKIFIYNPAIVMLGKTKDENSVERPSQF